MPYRPPRYGGYVGGYPQNIRGGALAAYAIGQGLQAFGDIWGQSIAQKKQEEERKKQEEEQRLSQQEQDTARAAAERQGQIGQVEGAIRGAGSMGELEGATDLRRSYLPDPAGKTMVLPDISPGAGYAVNIAQDQGGQKDAARLEKAENTKREEIAKANLLRALQHIQGGGDMADIPAIYGIEELPEDATARMEGAQGKVDAEKESAIMDSLLLKPSSKMEAVAIAEEKLGRPLTPEEDARFALSYADDEAATREAQALRDSQLRQGNIDRLMKLVEIPGETIDNVVAQSRYPLTPEQVLTLERKQQSSAAGGPTFQDVETIISNSQATYRLKKDEGAEVLDPLTGEEYEDPERAVSALGREQWMARFPGVGLPTEFIDTASTNQLTQAIQGMDLAQLEMREQIMTSNPADFIRAGIDLAAVIRAINARKQILGGQASPSLLELAGMLKDLPAPEPQKEKLTRLAGKAGQ